MKRPSAVFLLFLVSGCNKAPVGPEPADVCERQAKIVGGTQFNMPGCVSDYTEYRKENPKKYLCYSECVDKGGDREAFIACSKLCRQAFDK